LISSATQNRTSLTGNRALVEALRGICGVPIEVRRRGKFEVLREILPGPVDGAKLIEEIDLVLAGDAEAHRLLFWWAGRKAAGEEIGALLEIKPKSTLYLSLPEIKSGRIGGANLRGTIRPIRPTFCDDECHAPGRAEGLAVATPVSESKPETATAVSGACGTWKS
jgi:hypothetical protein